MANLLYAALDSHSDHWTDHTSASSAYLPASESSHTSSTPDTHVPQYILDDARRNGGIPDDQLAEALKELLPSVPDVRARPSLDLPEMGVWTCPQCQHTINPRDLRVEEHVIVAAHLGIGPRSGVVVRDNGIVELDTDNGWQFSRCVDCLAWSHYAVHLEEGCITFWFPSPASEYKVSRDFALHAYVTDSAFDSLHLGSGGTRSACFAAKLNNRFV